MLLTMSKHVIALNHLHVLELLRCLDVSVVSVVASSSIGISQGYLII